MIYTLIPALLPVNMASSLTALIGRAICLSSPKTPAGLGSNNVTIYIDENADVGPQPLIPDTGFSGAAMKVCASWKAATRPSRGLTG